METESVVTYLEGPTVRVLRGYVSGDNNGFITILRRDGTIRISKAAVVKIEEKDSDED